MAGKIGRPVAGRYPGKSLSAVPSLADGGARLHVDMEWTILVEERNMRDERKGLDIPEGDDVPRTYQRFTERFPTVAEAHTAAGRAGDQGPLDRKIVELIKLGICVGAGLESASKSHARRAVQHGATPEEVEHAVALAVNPVGFPRAVMAWQWVTEQLARE